MYDIINNVNNILFMWSTKFIPKNIIIAKGDINIKLDIKLLLIFIRSNIIVVPPDMYAVINAYRNKIYAIAIILLKVLPIRFCDILIIFESLFSHRDISNIAMADVVITNHTIKNIIIVVLKFIPNVFIGNPNIPAPIDVPDIKNMLPIILFNICFLWPEAESNRRHRDFQSLALPTELSSRIFFIIFCIIYFFFIIVNGYGWI